MPTELGVDSVTVLWTGVVDEVVEEVVDDVVDEVVGRASSVSEAFAIGDGVTGMVTTSVIVLVGIRASLVGPELSPPSVPFP